MDQFTKSRLLAATLAVAAGGASIGTTSCIRGAKAAEQTPQTTQVLPADDGRCHKGVVPMGNGAVFSAASRSCNQGRATTMIDLIFNPSGQ